MSENFDIDFIKYMEFKIFIEKYEKILRNLPFFSA